MADKRQRRQRPSPRQSEPRSGPELRLPEALVDEIIGRLLHYRARAEAGDTSWAYRALAEFKRLRDGLIGWTLPADVDWDKLSIEHRRELLADRLENDPIILPPGHGLSAALRDLNAGQVNAIVQPSRAQRRGKRPVDRARAEMDLLRWIAFESGRSGKAQDTIELELADEIHVAPENFDAWRHTTLPKVFGPEVGSELAMMKQLGAEFAAGLLPENFEHRRTVRDFAAPDCRRRLVEAYRNAR